MQSIITKKQAAYFVHKIDDSLISSDQIYKKYLTVRLNTTRALSRLSDQGGGRNVRGVPNVINHHLTAYGMYISWSITPDERVNSAWLDGSRILQGDYSPYRLQ